MSHGEGDEAWEVPSIRCSCLAKSRDMLKYPRTYVRLEYSKAHLVCQLVCSTLCALGCALSEVAPRPKTPALADSSAVSSLPIVILPAPGAALFGNVIAVEHYNEFGVVSLNSVYDIPNPIFCRFGRPNVQ